MRTFEATQATREQVPLIISLTGPSGCGKTVSALRLAHGIQRIAGGDIYMIDTEHKRSLHYADSKEFSFKFKHVDFGAPFGSLDYLAAIEYCVANKASTIVIDSLSHEHDGPMGLLESHEAELDRMAGSDYGKRERMTMLAWQKPKAARRRLINTMIQLGCNVVMNFRAGEKSKPGKDATTGKSKIIDMGFTPIAGPEFVYEATLGCLLLPRSNGVPIWNSDYPGEKMAMKLPGQFRDIMRADAPLSEDIGQRLAEWARGGAPAPQPVEAPPATLSGATEAAAKGEAALDEYVNTLTRPDKLALRDSGKGAELRAAAKAADAANTSTTKE